LSVTFKINRFDNGTQTLKHLAYPAGNNSSMAEAAAGPVAAVASADQPSAGLPAVSAAVSDSAPAARQGGGLRRQRCGGCLLALRTLAAGAERGSGHQLRQLRPPAANMERSSGQQRPWLLISRTERHCRACLRLLGPHAPHSGRPCCTWLRRIVPQAPCSICCSVHGQVLLQAALNGLHL
jgi:hypothetical protein